VCGVRLAVTSSSTTDRFGEDGTGGRILRLIGRFLRIGRRVIASIDGMKGAFRSGADGGQIERLVGIDANWNALSVSSGEVVVEAWVRRPWSNSPPIPSNSCSSFSSTRCSLRMLWFVLVLAMDSVRLRGAYRLRQTGPTLIPEPVELIDDAEDFRATTRSSMALSSA